MADRRGTPHPARAWWIALGGRNALSIWSWILPTVTAVAFTVTFEVPAFDYRLWPRIALVMSVQMLLIPLLLAGFLLLRALSRPRPWLGVVIFVALGIARGFIIDGLAPVIEPIARDALSYQLALNATYALLTLPFIAIVVDAVRRYRSLRAQVRDEALRWEHALSDAEAAFVREYAEYRDKVDTEVMARVIDLQDEIAARAREAAGAGAVTGADELRRLSAEVVRPLSHELILETTSIKVTPVPFASVAPRWEIRDVLRDASRAPAAGHWGLCTVMGLLGLVGLSPYGSIPLLVMNFAWNLVIFGLVPGAISVATYRAWQRLPEAWAWAASVAQWSVLGIIAVVSTSWLMRLTTGTGTVFWGVAILYVVLSALTVVALAGFRRQQDLQIELSDLLVRQEALASRLMMRIDRDRRELGLVLHGSVQAGLTRAAIALDRWGDTLDVAELPGVVAEVRIALDSAVGAFESAGQLAAGLDAVILERLRLWSGAVTCSSSIAPDAIDAIGATASKAIGDIVGEAVTNAVRHGQADAVSVDVSLDESVVVVRVRDNGTRPLSVRHPGAGLGLLARAGIPWTLERVGAWTEFTVCFPESVMEVPPAKQAEVDRSPG